MTATIQTVEPTTPTAVIDRISLVLDAFDGLDGRGHRFSQARYIWLLYSY